MALELIAAITLAFGVAGLVLLARKLSGGRIPKIALPASIACALIARNWSGLRTSGDFKDSTVSDGLRARMDSVHGISLTPRQAEIALLILKGHSSASIAMRLEISPQTVKVFRKQLYRKCAISSQAELFSLVMPLLSD